MASVLQTLFSDAFSWMKIFVFWLKFNWSLFLRVQFTIALCWPSLLQRIYSALGGDESNYQCHFSVTTENKNKFLYLLRKIEYDKWQASKICQLNCIIHRQNYFFYGYQLTISQHWFKWCWLKSLKPTQNGRHFADDIFKCIFLNENIWIWLKISLKFVP